MSQIYNLRNGIPRGAVRVDRRSPWGNQFMMRGTSEAERVRVCDAFEAWAMAPEQAAFRGWVRRDLAGKDLACWCAPKRCHAETLRRIANEDPVTCHDHDCVRRDECPHYLADLSVERHVVSGRSGGGCDLWDLEAGLAGFGE